MKHNSNEKALTLITILLLAITALALLALLFAVDTQKDSKKNIRPTTTDSYTITAPEITRQHKNEIQQLPIAENNTFRPTPTDAEAAQWIHSGMQIFIGYESADNPGEYTYSGYCTLGPVLTPTTALTAGHCAKKPNAHIGAKDPITGEYITIGSVDYSRYDENTDVARIIFNDAVPSRNVALSTITTDESVKGNTPVFKHGATSETTTGVITENIDSTEQIASTICSIRGDSGSPIWNSDGEIIGIVSAMRGAKEDVEKNQCGQTAETIFYPIHHLLTALDEYDSTVS